MKKLILASLSVMLINCTTIHASLDIMSYNVRRQGKDPEEFQWNKRKTLVFDQVLSKKPSVIGFQEVVKGQQFDDLKKALPEYESFGDSRNEHSRLFSLSWLISKHWNAKNECSPIFYNPKEVILIASGTFGLNPYLFSKQQLPRICTWGFFQDQKSKKQFYAYNTHLDNTNQHIRLKQLDIILKHNKIGKHNQSVSAILMGDFNTKIEGKIKEKTEKAGFVAAREIAKVVNGPKETRTGWHDKELKEIDHILVKNVKVKEFDVFVNEQGVYPSDHRAIQAKIELQ